MPQRASAWLVVRALWELLRFDVVMSLFGFQRIDGGLRRLQPTEAIPAPDLESAVCEAIQWAAALYCKRIRCLQRSTAMVRLLRYDGQRAELVIGCRPLPFFAHAWVEVDGRVVGDSPSYKKKLSVLDRA